MRRAAKILVEICAIFFGLAAAWLVAHVSEETVMKMMPDDPWKSPLIAHISLFPWTPLDRHTHFFSGAAQLGPALAMAAAAALLVEIAKRSVSARLAEHPNFFCAYFALIGFQSLVAASTFQRGAWDWSNHLNTVIFRHETGSRSFNLLNLRMEWPWTSLIPLGAFLALAFMRRYWRLSSKKLVLLPPVLLATSLAVPAAASWIRDDYYGGFLWPWLLAALPAAYLTEKLARLWHRKAAFSEDEPQGARSRHLVLPFLCGAWLVAFLTPWLRELWIPPGPQWPNFGNVAAFPWSEQAEPRSTTIAILGALVIGLAAAALIEPVKILRGGKGYGRLLLFQVILVLDAIATAAPDWSAYFVSQIWPAVRPLDPAIFPSWPWISLLVLLALFYRAPIGQDGEIDAKKAGH